MPKHTTVYEQASTPVGALTGALWIDTDTSVVQILTAAGWQEFGGTGGVGVMAAQDPSGDWWLFEVDDDGILTTTNVGVIPPAPEGGELVISTVPMTQSPDGDWWVQTTDNTGRITTTNVGAVPTTGTPPFASLADLKTRAGTFSAADYVGGSNGAAGQIAQAVADATAALTATRGAVVHIPSGLWDCTGGGSISGAVAGLARNTPNWLRIELDDGAYVRLSANIPRFLDFTRVADGDLFNYISLAGGTIDANNVTGNNHVVLGNRIGGSSTPAHEVSLNQIHVSGVRVVNVATGTDSAVTYRLGLALSSASVGDSALGTATTASGSNQLTLVSTTLGAFANGQIVVGTGIPAGATISSGGGTATLTMSANATASASGVTIVGIGSTSAEPLSTITNIHISDYHQEGGLVGIQIAGLPYNAGVQTSNTWIDEIHIRDSSHDEGATPTAFNIGNNLIIGNRGYGGRVTVTNFNGRNCSDCGLEFNALQDLTVTNSQAVNAWNHGYYNNNYHALADADAALHRYIGCSATHDSTTTSGQGWHYAQKSAVGAYGANIDLDSCRYEGDAQIWSIGQAADLNGPRRINIRGLHVGINLGTYSGASNQVTSAVRIGAYDALQSGYVTATADHVKVKVTGVKSGSGTITYTGLHLGQVGFVDFSADRPVIDFALNSICYPIMVGDNGSTPTVRGTITRPSLLSSGASSTSAIRIGRSSNTSINTAITIDTPEFAGMQASAVELDLQAVNGSTHGAKVQLIRPRWRNAKANVTQATTSGTGNISNASSQVTSATGTWKRGMQIAGTGIAANAIVIDVTGGTLQMSANATATTSSLAISSPGSPFVWANYEGYAVWYVIQGGTVTVVELAEDGSTYVDVGQTAGRFLVPPGARIRDTNSVAPTRTVVTPAQA